MSKEAIKTVAMGVLVVIMMCGIGISLWKIAFPYDEEQHQIHQENMKRAEIRKEMYE
jgi:regulatory protein YycH of two-component signal transduction system YycFG